MFIKKTMNTNLYAMGGDKNGLRYGSGNFSDSLDLSQFKLEKWKPQEGENLVNFIPFNAGKKHPLVATGNSQEGDPVYSLDYYIHRSIGPNKCNVVCLKQYNQDCPLCREQNRLWNLGTEDSQKQAKDLRNKRRVVYLVHDLKHNTYGYWDTGWQTVEEKLMKLSRVKIDPRTNSPVNVFDWETGYSVKFYGEKKKFESYDYIDVDLFELVQRPPLTDEELSHSVDISEGLKMTTAEDMEKMISGDPASQSAPIQAAPASQPTATQSAYEEAIAANIESDTADLAAQAMAVANPSAPSFDTMEAAPAPQPTQAAVSQKSGKTCPYGYAWGTSEDHKECASCPVWEDCMMG